MRTDGRAAHVCVCASRLLIDCQRYKFLEVRYHRIEKEPAGSTGVPGTKKPGDAPSVVETVVIFIPDVWSVVPTRNEFEVAAEAMKKQRDEKIAELDKPKEEPQPAAQPAAA